MEKETRDRVQQEAGCGSATESGKKPQPYKQPEFVELGRMEEMTQGSASFIID